MTSYNERLDKLLLTTLQEMSRELEAYGYLDSKNYLPEKRESLTSLIRELVAEAKPTNSATQRGSVTVYGDLSERDLKIINQFEQNLLKALGEV